MDDPDDNKFLECAVEAKAEFVICGDPHLLRIGRYKAVKIVDVEEFLEFSKECVWAEVCTLARFILKGTVLMLPHYKV